MAKKKPATTKSSAAKKAAKPSAGKPSAGKPSKKAPSKQQDHEHDEHDEEIELDETESKAVDLALESDDLRIALEVEVNAVVTQAVRKVCKAHGVSLTAAQAQNVAMMLFGD